jgi:DNA-binding transcriptional MerR regulator
VGVLPVPKRASGQRLYQADVFRHIRLIQTAQKAGFSIEEIKTLLDRSEIGKLYAERLQELAHRKLADVEQLIADTQAMKQILEAALACRCATIEDCLLFIKGDG